MSVPRSKPQVKADVIRALEAATAGPVYSDLSLRALSRWRIGGMAKCVVHPTSTQEVAAMVRLLRDAEVPYIIVGHTSNLLFSDDGLDAVCIRVAAPMSKVLVQDSRLSCGGGAWVPSVAKRAAQHCFSGVEHICGIPGTIAGLVAMNGGSLRQSISESIKSVTTVDSVGAIRVRKVSECKFAYRKSRFQDGSEIITSVELGFSIVKGTSEIRRRMIEIMRGRRQKFPHRLPNCGSVFLSDAKTYTEIGPPGRVVESLGLKGTTRGGAQISPLHGNFINNIGNARAQDVLDLVATVRRCALKMYEVELLTEAKFVTPEGTMLPLDAAADAWGMTLQ